jgi:hypothetical protein
MDWQIKYVTHRHTCNLSCAYSIVHREIKWSNHLISLLAIPNLWFAVITKCDYFQHGRKVLGFVNAELEVAYRQTGCTVVSQDRMVEPSCELDAHDLFLPQQWAAVLCEAHMLFTPNSEKFWHVPSSTLAKILSALLLRDFWYSFV